MAYAMKRLPSRFPVGTKFVIEGTRREGQAQVFRRYLELPDGTHIASPARPSPRKPASKSASRKRRVLATA